MILRAFLLSPHGKEGEKVGELLIALFDAHFGEVQRETYKGFYVLNAVAKMVSK